MAAQLVADALMMTIWRRGKPDALLHHSDQGSHLRFNQLSQQQAVPTVAPGQTSRQAFASRASSVAWC